MDHPSATKIVLALCSGVVGGVTGIAFNLTGHGSCASPILFGAAGLAFGAIIAALLPRSFDRYIERMEAERVRRYLESPEGRRWQAEYKAVCLFAPDEARARADELLAGTPTRPAQPPVAAEISSIPCGVGELLNRFSWIDFGEYGEVIAERFVERRTVRGRELVFFGCCEGGAFAVELGAPPRVIACSESGEPSPDDLSFPTVYHLLLHFGPEGLPDHCPKCGYSLEGLEHPIRCPECGSGFTRGD